MACNWFVILVYVRILILGARVVGVRCVHPWIWVSKAFQTTEVVLDATYTQGWGHGIDLVTL